MMLFKLLFVEQMLAILVVGFGFWMSTHNDECRRSLTVPVMALGGVIFLMYDACLELYFHYVNTVNNHASR
jgi:hypothetical protein